MDKNLIQRVLDAVPTGYAPFGYIASEKLPDEEQSAVKAALDNLVVTGRVELVYGRGYRRIPAEVEVRYADLKVTNLDSGSAIGHSETRYRIQIGDAWDAWWVTYGDSHGSGAEWQDDHGQMLSDPDHILVTQIPDDVVARSYDIADDADEARLEDVLTVLCEDVDEAYWPAWRERVGAVEDALKADLLPWSPTATAEES
jgi:hypothetical protein